jgi:hypothetical protein
MMSKDIANILECAAKLIETKGWTQGSYARDANDGAVSSLDKNAECFCIIGALSHVSLGYDSNTRRKAYQFATNIIHNERLTTWNDDPARTKEEVITFLKSAAELARKETR